MSEPRLLLLSTSGVIGGAERMVVNLAREFQARQWSVRTIFTRTAQSDALLDWCRDQGVVAETHPAVLDTDAPRSVREILALRRLVRRSKATVVNLHYALNFISIKDVLAVRLAGVQPIVTVHHPTPWADVNPRKRQMTRLTGYLAQAVVVPSRATRDTMLEAGIPARKIRLIPNGLRIPTNLPTRAEARRSLGLPEEAFIVVSLAQLVAHKGIADVIEAVARVPDPCGDMMLVVAGDGPERGTLEQLAAARLGDGTRFLGRVPDTADVYAAADVFALPSRMEGFGLVYVEAAFHGVPSIGANVGGVPDVIADGETGLLVPQGDVPALATATERLRDSPELRHKLGEAARTRACTEFTETRMAERYLELFDHVIHDDYQTYSQENQNATQSTNSFQPHITVVIPTCNRPDDVRRCLDSLSHVSYPHWDILLLDQSDDTLTRDVAVALAEALPRLTHRPMPEKGLSRARNVGLAEADGEILAFLDDDCTVDPDWLQQIAGVFARHRKAAITFGTVRPTPYNKREGWITQYQVQRERVLRGRFSLIQPGPMGASMYLRPALLKQVGLFDEHLGAGAVYFTSTEEWEYAFRALAQGQSIVETPCVVVHHHGLRDYRSGAFSRSRQQAAFSDGAADMKLLRCGDAGALLVIAAHTWKLLKQINIRNLVLRRGPNTLAPLAMYVYGLCASFRLAIDRPRHLYKNRGA